MKKKWIVLASVVLALGALVATAAAHRGGQGMRAVMQELDLTDEQRDQLKELRQAHREKMKDARGDGPEVMKGLHEEHRAALGEVLNAEQLERMQAMRADFAGGFRGGKMRGHRGMRGHGPGAKNAFAKLDLTDAQKDQLKDLRKAHRAEVGKLQKQHREALEKLLTDEQRAELAELKDEAFYGGKRRHRRGMW